MTLRRPLIIAVLLVGIITSALILAQEQTMDQRLVNAEQIYRTEGPARALPEFLRLLEVFEDSGEIRSIALAQGYIGACHWRLGNYDQARRYLDTALKLKRQIGDRLQEGKTLNVLGLLDWDLGNFDGAIERFTEASNIGNEINDARLEGATLNNLSLVYDELGDYRTSLDQYHQVLDIYSNADFPRGKGDTLGNIGGVYLLLGYYTKAADYYQQALKISEQLESVAAMSQDHGNLGMAYTGIGRKDLALQHFDRALELAGNAGMRKEQAAWMRGKANAQIMAGHYDLGLESYRTAIDIFEEVGAQTLLLEALHDMGQLTLMLGDPASAEQYFQRAITLARGIGLSRVITMNLLSLGDLQYRHQRLVAAAVLYKQALQRAQDAEEQTLISRALLRLSRVFLDQQRYEEGFRASTRALEIARATGAQLIEATALHLLAELDRTSGDSKSALRHYKQADALSKMVGDPDLQWQIEYGRALAQIQTGKKEAAIVSLTAAVGYIEGIRNRLREKRYREGFIQDKHQVYIELVRLQMALGHTSDAFATAERLRSWAYIGQSGVSESPGLSEEQQQAKNELRERMRQLQRNLEEERIRTVPERRQLAIETFSYELVLAERNYQAFLDDTADRNLNQDIPAVKAREAAIQRRLQPEEALIEYVVGTENIMIFVLTSDDLLAMTTSANQDDLHSRLELLRTLLIKRDTERWKRPAKSLAGTLFTPIHEQGWLNGKKHLYLVPHGILNYLPFALLPVYSSTGQQPMIEQYTLSYLPAASSLADGVSNYDSRHALLAVAPGNSRLQYASEEVRSIGELFKPHAQLLIGNDATESAFKKTAGNFQVLHLATHGYFNKLNPLLSGLQMEADRGNDGLLEVHEILNLKLHSDLVTLSACETALGSGFFSEIPAGDDFVGMTRAFLQAGSASVLATLWEVDDRSTVGLMNDFYQRLDEFSTSQAKAAALANAQRILLASSLYKHPYYWAPFILVGSMNQAREARS